MFGLYNLHKFPPGFTSNSKLSIFSMLIANIHMYDRMDQQINLAYISFTQGAFYYSSSKERRPFNGS